MTAKRIKIFDSVVTALWLLTDTLWALGLNKLAIVTGIILCIAQMLLVSLSITSTMLTEFSIFCWTVFNTIWIVNDTYPDKTEIKVSMVLICIVTWIVFLITLKKGIVPKRGKIWK